MAFPGSPTMGQQHTIGANTWEWNGDGWRKIVATSGNLLAWAEVSPRIILDADRTTFADETPWMTVDYV